MPISWRIGPGGGLNAVEVEVRAAQRENRGAYHRCVGRLAPRQHQIDREDLAGQVAPPRRHSGFQVVRVPAQLGDHRRDRLRGWRHHRQSVGPSLIEVPLDQIDLIDGADRR